jgi:hypothetical protein
VTNPPATPTITWSLGCINAFETEDQFSNENCIGDGDADGDGPGFISPSSGASTTYIPPFYVTYGLVDSTVPCPSPDSSAVPPFAYVPLTVTAQAGTPTQTATQTVCIQVTGN